MKRFIEHIILGVIVLYSNPYFACEACKKKQPAITRNLVHGVGPDSDWDWLIVGVVILLTLISLFLSIKYLFRPGEKDPSHIKYSVFQK